MKIVFVTHNYAMRYALCDFLGGPGVGDGSLIAFLMS